MEHPPQDAQDTLENGPGRHFDDDSDNDVSLPELDEDDSDDDVASRAVAYQSKTGTKHMEQLQELLQTEGFIERLESASKDPEGADAKALLRTITPLVRTTGKQLKWSPLEPANDLADMYSMAQRFGLHDGFITFSQMASNQPPPSAQRRGLS